VVECACLIGLPKFKVLLLDKQLLSAVYRQTITCLLQYFAYETFPGNTI
jgi:hypothetical protein